MSGILTRKILPRKLQPNLNPNPHTKISNSTQISALTSRTTPQNHFKFKPSKIPTTFFSKKNAKKQHKKNYKNNKLRKGTGPQPEGTEMPTKRLIIWAIRFAPHRETVNCSWRE